MQVSQCDSDLLRSGNGLTAEGGCGQATSFKRWRPFGPNAVTGWIGNTLGGGLGEKMHHENVLAKMEVFLVTNSACVYEPAAGGSTSTSPWHILTRITQPKCVRAAAGMSMFRNDVATIAKPNTLQEERRETQRNTQCGCQNAQTPSV